MKLEGMVAAAVLAVGSSLGIAADAVADNAEPRVVSFDHGGLDTLDAMGLGDHVVAVPKRGLPEYLSDYASDAFADAGNLKTPDLKGVREAKPTLILVTGRQGDQIAELEKIAPTVNVGMVEGAYFTALEAKVLGLAAPFHAGEQAHEALDDLKDYIAEQRSGIDGEPDVLVVTHNDGKFGLRLEPVVYELLALPKPVLPEGVESFTRGTRVFTPLTPEVIAQMDPDELLVVDRSAAIGAGEIDLAALKSSLAEHGMDGDKVTVLSPGLWYLSGGGLQSVRLQVDEVTQAL
ncbi:siderophore ABC transporter substrate-binding protein [Marinobacter nanhaiticus D15-8W]|nr:ABC transporter substrate-binding protein [Marinobacter nanhaiticus]BES69123.1 siderophore ABC transporter substrate-binding protein [Marinobacter nanhaiticus D15-8W]